MRLWAVFIALKSISKHVNAKWKRIASKQIVTIAIPNDATNEKQNNSALEKNGYIKLKKGAGITATVGCWEDANGIEFKEVEAAQVANTP